MVYKLYSLIEEEIKIVEDFIVEFPNVKPLCVCNTEKPYIISGITFLP
ncbi:MAG: hypothetical protein AABY84_07150 [Candidatus Firestonebacteria bacterium]